MKVDQFLREISAASFENVFNPYSQQCSVFDGSDAPRVRRKLLRDILAAASTTGVDSIWLGRDLGYRGGRRTGLALTDDVHLSEHAGRWGIEVNRPTKGEAVSERTAAVVWSVLSSITCPVFLWNVFPFHPYMPEDPFSNRNHNARERAAGEKLLISLIDLLKPTKIVAIGNDAETVVKKVGRGLDVVKVRHPSYGGQTDFVKQVQGIYEGTNWLQGRLI